MLLLLIGRLYRRVCHSSVRPCRIGRSINIRRSNSTTCHHEVVVLGHTSRRFYYFIFIVRYDFDPL